jgi:hypothetical protein
VVYYGDPLPNTYYLKATGIAVRSMLAAGWMNLTDTSFGALHGRFWIALALFTLAAAVGVRRSVIARLLVATVLLHWSYFVWIGGDWMMVHLSRFLVQVMPLVIVLVITQATSLLRLGLRRRTALEITHRRRIVRGALALQGLVLAVALNQDESLKEWWSAHATPFARAENERSYVVARYIAQHADESTVVGAYWAGVLPYYCDLRMVDLLGRTDRHIARGKAVPTPVYFPGHAKRDWDYVLHERKPDLILAQIEEMANRPDYLDAYCLPHGEHWVALRRDAVWKWTRRDVYIRCGPK